MRIELLNQSKYRHGARPGDDVALVVPGVVYGVFDGATDARGTMAEGVAAGRLAALTVSSEMAALAADPANREIPGEAMIDRLSQALKRRTDPLDVPIPPSTTVAVVLDCGADWRFVLLGDSGIRINGQEVLQRDKVIDDVSTAARVRLFARFRGDQPATDAVEYAARRGILLGLDQAVTDRALTPAEAEAIISEVLAETGLQAEGAAVSAFLRGGIQTQYRLGNAMGPLGFDTMNGTRPCRGEVTDLRRPKAQVRSIEVFSDGYPDLPSKVSATAWEEAFHAAERLDYHKTGAFAGVKGSTATEYFDDRTVLVLADMMDRDRAG